MGDCLQRAFVCHPTGCDLAYRWRSTQQAFVVVQVLTLGLSSAASTAVSLRSPGFMNHCILRRWLTGITMLMMVVAAAGYASHQHGDASHPHTVHCDVCAAFAATAGAQRPPIPLRLRVVVIDEPRPVPHVVRGTPVIFSAHSPRAPPLPV